MTQPNQPVRVIYAKLTSTGAYDVVAKTANIPLDRARALAEKLLPGNPPLDARVAEELAHVRPAEGGHVIWRFARYDWTDGDRGDVFLTDIVWLSDADFERARANAFAVVPHSTGVFAELTELPPVAVPDRTPQADMQRLSELQPYATEAKTVVASSAAAESVLLVHNGDRARAMELFTLLLPPRMRAQLTFQTQAFRVPQLLPRVTLVDRGSANLRDAGWRVLPSVDVDVPLELAGRLVALADDPETLALAHDLYDEAFDDAVDLRAGIMRLTKLAEAAHALRQRDAAIGLRTLTASEPRVRAAVLKRLTSFADAHVLIRGLVELQQQGGEAARQVLPLLRELDARAESSEATAALIDALPAGAPDELRSELALRAAQHGDYARLLALISSDARALLPKLPIEQTQLRDDVRRLLLALREANSTRIDLDVAARLLQEAVAVQRVLPPAAAGALHRLCRDAVLAALERTAASSTAVASMTRLQDVANSYATAYGASAPLPPLLTDHQLAQVSTDNAAQLVDDYSEPARAVIGAALLTRAWTAQQHGHEPASRSAAAVAVRLLAAAGPSGRELARQVLTERNVREHDLLALPGADALLPLLGGNAAQAAVTRRIINAITALGTGPETALPELASAVYAAHAQKVRIRPNTELSQRVLSALHDLQRAQQQRTDATAAEICVELLALITEPAHIVKLEDAALGDGMVVRLNRLDRSIVHCRAAEDETLYERYASAVESALPLDSATRERLRDALGTGGIKRRLLRAVSSVVERDAS